MNDQTTPVTQLKFVQNVLDKNYVDAKEQFKELFYAKSMERLESKKIEVARKIYSEESESTKIDS
jgi:hypothetical protein